MKKLLLLSLVFLAPAAAFAAADIDLGYGWSLKGSEMHTYRGSSLFYNGNLVYYFRTCAEQSNICNAVTSDLKAGRDGVFVEYFQGGNMDPGIYRISKDGRFIGQNTDQKNICSTFASSCQYQGFSVFSRTKLRLSYTVSGKKRFKLIDIK